MKEKIDNLLEQMSDHDHVKNVKLIEKTFGTLFYRNRYNETILHILVQTSNEEKAFLL